MRELMKCISNSSDLELQTVVTGMHLSIKHGFTYQEIERAGFKINCKVDMLLDSDNVINVTKSIGIGTIGFAEAYASLCPDLIVVLGDRFELIPAVNAALIACIPVAHIHGGEVTEGAFDDAIRHSITKMSHLHFVAAPEYARRVIQLGESPDRVFIVGGLGVDSIKKINFLPKESLEELLDFKFGVKNLLVTYHPVTLEGDVSTQEMSNLLEVLSELDETNIIFTMPNADTGSYILSNMIQDFVDQHSNARVYSSLGQINYLSCMQFVDGVIGNSSSGLAEAPSMGVGTINIGNRQKGRLCASSVINCSSEPHEIQNAIKRLYSPIFRESLRNTINPYGDGGASEKITEIIKKFSLHGLLNKKFYDIPIMGI